MSRCPECNHPLATHQWDRASVNASSPPEYFCRVSVGGHLCGCEYDPEHDEAVDSLTAGEMWAEAMGDADDDCR